MRLLAFATVLILAPDALAASPPKPLAAAAFENMKKAAPNDLSILFALGVAALQSARSPGIGKAQRDRYLDAAITYFHQMIVIRPSLLRPRLELASAFYQKGEDSLARRHFERVLAGKPPAMVVRNIHRFLGLLRARKRWSGYAGLALAPDSNIGSQSSAETVSLFGLPFRLNEGSRPSSGVGLSVWGGAEYQQPIANDMRWRFGGGFWRREYAHSRFDSMMIDGRTGPRFFVGRIADVSLLFNVRQLWQGGRPTYSDVGFRIESSERFGRHLSARQTFEWHNRAHESAGAQNGPRWGLTLAQRWQALPTLSLGLTAGYRAERPKLARTRQPWLRLSATWALPWGFTVGGSVARHWTVYERGWKLMTRGAERRKDTTTLYRLSLHNRGWEIGGFSPQIVGIYEHRTTNAQIYGFRRLRGEFQMQRQF